MYTRSLGGSVIPTAHGLVRQHATSDDKSLFDRIIHSGDNSDSKDWDSGS